MKIDWWEFIGDGLIIAFGLCMGMIFIIIEVKGMYAMESNVWMRWFEMLCSVPIVLIGVRNLIKDLRK